MVPSEKKLVMSIVDEHGDWNVDCVKTLFVDCHIPLKDMQHLRVCYELAKEHPEHLELEEPVSSAITVAPEVLAASKAQKSVTDGLTSFQLKPDGLVGLELFEHLTKYVRRHQSVVGALEPSPALNVEMTNDQRTIIAPTAQDLTCRELMKDAGGSAQEKSESPGSGPYRGPIERGSELWRRPLWYPSKNFRVSSEFGRVLWLGFPEHRRAATARRSNSRSGSSTATAT